MFAIAQATLTSLLRNRLTNFLLGLVIIFSGLCLLMATVDVGIRFRLFENLLISSQTLLLYGVAWLFGFDLLRREQQEYLFILPLSTGIDRKHYLIGRFVGLTAFILLVGAFLLIMDSFFLIWLEQTIELAILGQIILSTAGAILAAAIVMGFGVKVSAFSAVIYSLLLWVIGHGLDELVIFADKRLSESLQKLTDIFYYVLPNFSLTDHTSEVLNRIAIPISDWFIISAYCICYSGLIIAIASVGYEKKALIGNE